MRSVMFLLTTIACALAGGLFSQDASLSKDASQNNFAGLIEEIRGKTYLKQDARTEVVILDRKRDLYRRLHVGERLRCDKGGLLKLQLYGGVTEIKESSVWFPIPLISSSHPELKHKALELYGRLGGRLGGRDRGTFSSIISPEDESSINPKGAVFRWIPKEGVGISSFVIVDKTGKALWSDENVDGASGRLASNSAREALVRYREGGAHEEILLIMTDSKGRKTQVSFFVLSTENELALERELNTWEEETDLMRHVGRAYSFWSRQMFSDAAEEYDAALTLHAESRDLLVAAIQAYRRAGNSVRWKELKQGLPPGAELPD